ncbi:sensor histidine kinase [Virgibacillus halodenitrificans]|uniref:sensor histidine kinase n=1 Tax=Virgibacillus halodenitrificans TaxID=1482 RepID=UPI001FB31644|nr:sensor histidine kinase [Virgibacillus halodenitrificans]MCJ0932673.1 sensor histidine kinase [Virgibacillus halodenitrificans]
MNTVIRHIFTAVLLGFILTFIVTVVTLFVFVDDWSLIAGTKVGEVNYLVVLFGIPIVGGLIIGIVTGTYWQQQLRHIEKQMDELLKGRKVKAASEFKEIKKIETFLIEIQEKIRDQTEAAQRLATDRATEREKSLQEVVVQERNRLARELHDSVSQQLFAASMMMSAINEENTSTPVRKQLHLVENMIQQSQMEMRALLLHLRPVALKGKSLHEGIKELLLELTEKVPMKITWKIEAFHLDKGVEDQLFRVTQESVSNTLRHSKATNLEVILMERDETVILRVVDNGIGFNIDTVKTNSYGLQNMRERAFEIGGSFKIISIPGEGTRMEIKVPNLGKEGEHHD